MNLIETPSSPSVLGFVPRHRFQSKFFLFFLFFLQGWFFAGCATRAPNENADPTGGRILPEIKACETVFEKIKFRNQFFNSIRGRATFSTPDGNLDMEVAVRDPNLLRVEVVGPLGVRVALFVVNSKWVQLFVPREKIVYRLPFEEFQKDSLRRDYFLKDLPFPSIPEFLVPSLLTQVQMDKQKPRCQVDDLSHSLVLELNSGDLKNPSIRYWIDAETGHPVKVQFFRGKMNSSGDRADLEVEYSKFKGEGASRFPLQSRFERQGRELPFEWNWNEVEVWENPSLEAFEWRPPASIFVKDF